MEYLLYFILRIASDLKVMEGLNRADGMLAVVDLVSSEDEIEDDNLAVEGIPGVTVPFHFVVEGPPQAMPRPTSIAWIKMGKMRKACFNGKKNEIKTFHNKCMLQLRNRGITSLPVIPQGGVAMTISFYRKVPLRQRVIYSTAGGNQTVRDTMKPDIDNLLKFVLDALTGVVYKDDDQVVKVTVEKLIDTVPPYEGRTVVKCMPINPGRHFGIEQLL